MRKSADPLECMEGARYLVYNVSTRVTQTQIKDAKELDAYMRANRGCVCMVEWQDVTGWRASEYATQCASRLVAIKRLLGHA